MYWRIQESGHSIHGHTSSNWGFSVPEELETGAICACSNADSLASLIHEWYAHCPEYLDGQEVVVFWGTPVRDLGDGWLVSPSGESERMTAQQFVAEYMDGAL